MKLHLEMHRFAARLIPRWKYLIAGAMAVVLAGCGSGSSDMGTVRASITDAPSCGYNHVYVTVSQVSFNSSTNGSGGWYNTNPPTPMKIDLPNPTNCHF